MAISEWISRKCCF